MRPRRGIARDDLFTATGRLRAAGAGRSSPNRAEHGKVHSTRPEAGDVSIKPSGERRWNTGRSSTSCPEVADSMAGKGYVIVNPFDPWSRMTVGWTTSKDGSS